MLAEAERLAEVEESKRAKVWAQREAKIKETMGHMADTVVKARDQQERALEAR